MLESKIQAEIVQYLQHRGIFRHSVPNEQGHSNAIRTGQLVAMGLWKGTADLVVWLGDGKIAYCEVKTEVSKQSVDQKKFEQMCIANGYPYKVVRSVTDVEEFLNELQVARTK